MSLGIFRIRAPVIDFIAEQFFAAFAALDKYGSRHADE